MTGSEDALVRSWNDHDADRAIGRGHPIGEFLEAWKWPVLERSDGHIRVTAHLPDAVRNPRRELFGGFTPTYVDLISLFAVKTKSDRGDRLSLATLSMRIDYLEPVMGPSFVLDSRVEATRGLTDHVLTKFLVDDAVAVIATTTMRTIERRQR